MKEDLRRVQQVGESTFVVSLPKGWVVERGLHKGEYVSISEEEDGSIRIHSGVREHPGGHLRCIISADKCGRPGLLIRLVAGSYILGAESCMVLSRRGLSQQHQEELRAITKRLNGMTIVEESPTKVVLQSFVNPTMYSVDGLLRRLFIITSTMEQGAYRALRENRADLVKEVAEMEDDVDSFYRLIVRQLTLASSDRKVAKAIGINSSADVLTCRLVAEMLENIGDLVYGLANEVLTLKKIGQAWSGITAEVCRQLESSIKILDITIQAYFSGDAALANEVIELAQELASKESSLTHSIFQIVGEGGMLGSADASMEGVIGARFVISSTKEIANRCCTIAEMIIDRSLETPTDLASFQKIQEETLATFQSKS